ncbi:hypothetical protein D9758_015871 [Tetrapyrgos nigripes]|uniref:Catalase n=1 Tax=Tetrapyrgos nigripes TaxID=182062 RepID=A0A8H5CL75_9AGAR|nr:hypothetical protein D9758_015871 [Tetrapyrgos nigripes]
MRSRLFFLQVSLWHVLFASATCPIADSQGDRLVQRRSTGLPGDDGFLDQFVVNDTDSYTTTDSGTPVDDTHSLKAGERGPTLLEDFVLRTKITRFDHERIPERAVHARGAAAHGYFESYADWSNITAASFLNQAGKQTPIFLRFSTVAGSRGSADTARDDAIQFPDLIHAVKPRPDNEIPQAQTAHDSAYDFFSQNPSTLHTLFWALSGYGIPRSYRHIDGFGVHTYRFVNADGASKLIKFHFKTQQGKASLIWPEALALAGQDPDYHRKDLFNAIAAGSYPSWEVSVQIMDEEDVTRYGFDLLDPTKIVPETIVPLTPIGKFVLNRNPINYFAETEQVMFCPGHIVRGIDFSDDPLLQGRLFSYVDTQLNRNMGSPNFEQIPINRPRNPVHNNNRDGAGQQFLHTNTAPYTFNTLNNGSPKPANQTQGNGFFTAPARRIVDASYVREISPTFLDHWTQPRLFYNSILPAEQQMIINALRFELAHVQSMHVRSNFIAQINMVDNDMAVRVATAIGIDSPSPNPTYYHDNTTTGLSIFNGTLSTIAGLSVGILATTNSSSSIAEARALAQSLASSGASGIVIGETLQDGVDLTYIASDAVLFDGIIITDGTQALFESGPTSNTALYPPQRPLSIVRDTYFYAKPIAAVAEGQTGLLRADIQGSSPGVRMVNSTTDAGFLDGFKEDLMQFKFLDRYPLDSN